MTRRTISQRFILEYECSVPEEETSTQSNNTANSQSIIPNNLNDNRSTAVQPNSSETVFLGNEDKCSPCKLQPHNPFQVKYQKSQHVPRLYIPCTSSATSSQPHLRDPLVMQEQRHGCKVVRVEHEENSTFSQVATTLQNSRRKARPRGLHLPMR